MRKPNNTDLLFIVLFGLIILYPTLDAFLGLSANVESHEKRALAKMPVYEGQDSESYIQGVEKYYTDNFGGRNLFITAFCKLKLNLFGSSPFPEQVVLGQEGWTFLGESKGSIYSEHQGVRVYNKKLLARSKQNILDNKDWLSSMGIGYYLFIAPDKYSIYPEKLPSHFDDRHNHLNLDRFINFMKPELDVIDVREELIAGKEKMPTYGKTDSHWTQYGAFLGYRKLIQTMNQDYPSIGRTRRLSEFRVKLAPSEHKDMAHLMHAKDKFPDIETVMTPKDGKNFRQVKSQLRIPRGYKGDPKNYEIRYKSNKSKGPKILVFRDSFSNKLRAYLPYNFSEIIFISNNHKFDRSIIEKENPDIVLHEIVERNIMETFKRY